MRRFAPARLSARLLLVGAIGLAPARVLAQGPMPGPVPTGNPPAAGSPHAPVRSAVPERAPTAHAPPRHAAPEHAPEHVPARHATPIVQPRGPTHPAKPPAERQPAQPLPLPLPLPPPDPTVGQSPPGSTIGPATNPAAPGKPEEPEKPVGSGLPLPRFAALRSDDVNLRAGPGTRYPIDWVYKRRDLPVEIEREFEVWRLVRDPDGVRGWIHQATLTGRRTFMVQGADATLRAEPNDDAAAVAVLKVGVIGRIRSCEAGSGWCRMQVGEYRGYLQRSQFWGALPDEIIAP